MHFSILTALTRAHAWPALRQNLLNGQIQAALGQAEALLQARSECSSDPQEVSALACLNGDLMLALEREEEAEACYHLAVRRAVTADKSAVRLASSRGSAFMRLHQQQYPMAGACFERLLADECTSAPLRIEALCGLAICKHASGHHEAALHLLAQAARIQPTGTHENLDMMRHLVEAKLRTSAAIRSQGGLQDHVLWQATGSLEPALQRIEEALRLYGDHPLVAQDLGHQRLLLQMSHQEAHIDAPAIHHHLSTLRSAGLRAREYELRLDTALMAIVRRQTGLLRTLLQPLQGADAGLQWRRHWSLELAYCQARLHVLSGDMELALSRYQRYAQEAIHFTRGAAAPLARGGHGMLPKARTNASDDIEIRLPARYRKAYRYMLEHLPRFELSVREIASTTGVTERALQQAFKASVGMTPGEVMQRARVEGIRADLLDERVDATNVIETAARWGIRNRSTLLSCYRKFFRETPTQTLARRGLQTAAGLA